MQLGDYEPINVNVTSQTGETYNCRCYRVACEVEGDWRPSPHYKKVIISGAMENNLPEEYIEKLKCIEDNGYTGKIRQDLQDLVDRL